MNAYPFTVFKRSNRPFYFVSYKDTNGKFLSPVSTKKISEKEAMQVAFEWLRDGIPKKKTAMKVHDLSLMEIARNIKTEAEVDTFLMELKRLGWLKTFVLNDTPQAEDFITFLKTFWDWDTSPYINEKRQKKHGIHKRHCRIQGQAITLYWEPFFKGRYLGEITAKDITAFINDLGKKSISASRKNGIIKAGTKALRWAHTQEIIEKDPTKGHLLFSGEVRKRHILNPTAAAAAFRVDWKNDRAKLANMLASVTGMRSGEILALRFQDIGPDCLYVRSAWNRLDGIKLPKNNETRIVEVPFPDLIDALIEQAKHNHWGFSSDSFVFWSDFHKERPMEGYLFVDGLREGLMQIGYSKDETAKYLFHGWRHFFTAYMVRKLDRKLLKSQTGHKTDDMIEHYGDHEIIGDRETIQATTKETFAGLIPERQKLLMFKNEPQAFEACS